jgi:hypothetical protein
MNPKTHISGLNELQIALLRMFSHNIPDEEILEIRRILVSHLSERLLSEVDVVVAEKGIAETDYTLLESAHFRTKRENLNG